MSPAKLHEQGHTTDLLPAPTTDPAPLSDVEGGETNLLPRSAWSDPANPLKVKFASWENSAPTEQDPEKIQIFLNGIEIGCKEWTASISPGDLFVPIDADKLLPGEHKLTYVVTIWSGTSQGSDPFTISIDKDAPLLNPSSKLDFPFEVRPPQKITAAYLATHEDQVLATLPDYSGKKAGDVITWYWEVFPDGEAVVDTWTLDIDDLAKPLELVFPGEVLRNRGNGDRHATYRVLDRAGNDSGLSSRETLDVNIQPPPLRKYPTVKEAQNGAGTGQLDTQFYGVSGVTVVVPKQDDASPGQKLEVHWKGYGDLGSHFAPLPNPSNASHFPIPPKAIPANIGEGRSVEIWYTVANSGLEPEKSDPFKLSAKAIPTNKFMKIDCPLAARGSPLKLKLSAVPSDGTPLTLAAWVYQADTQLINIWLTDANSRREDIRIAWPVTMGTNRAMLPKTFLAGVRINSTFSVHVSVSFDGGDTYLSFPSQDIQLLDENTLLTTDK